MAEERKARVMLDTTVLVAGSGWPRWPYEVLLAYLRGEVQLVLSPYILDQARRTLRKRFSQHLQRFEDFIALAPIELVPDPPQEDLASNRHLVRDRTDLPIVLAAINSNVDYLISEDKDLTAQDATTAALHKRLAVRLPGTFLREVLGWTSERLEQVRGRSWKDLQESGKS